MTLAATQEIAVTVPMPAIAFGSAVAAVVPTPVSLPIPLVGQHGSFWCWAACAEMVDRWRKGLAHATSQCGLASTHVTPNCCGHTPPSNQRDRGLSAAGITEVWHQLGYANASATGNIGLSGIDTELQARRPVQIGLTGAAGGHVVLVVGVNAGATQYTIHDPLPLNTGSVTLASSAHVTSGLGQGKWTDTWISI